MTAISRTADHQALEARLGLRLAATLTDGAERLPHDVVERLRFGREQALVRARDARLAAPATSGVVGGSRAGGLVLGSFAPWLLRAASLLPLLLLVGGLLMIQHWSSRERLRAAAEVDSLLLADSLPPNAYSDPGFAEFLRSEPRP